MAYFALILRQFRVNFAPRRWHAKSCLEVSVGRIERAIRMFSLRVARGVWPEGVCVGDWVCHRLGSRPGERAACGKKMFV